MGATEVALLTQCFPLLRFCSANKLIPIHKQARLVKHKLTLLCRRKIRHRNSSGDKDLEAGGIWKLGMYLLPVAPLGRHSPATISAWLVVIGILAICGWLIWAFQGPARFLVCTELVPNYCFPLLLCTRQHVLEMWNRKSPSDLIMGEEIFQLPHADVIISIGRSPQPPPHTPSPRVPAIVFATVGISHSFLFLF